MKAEHDPVRIRRKKTTNGGASLYLDIYADGRRRYEFLHLYLLPDIRANKAKNAEVLALAETIRAKRLAEVRGGLYGLNTPTPDVLLFDYFLLCLERRRQRGGQRWTHWRSTLFYLRKYERREGVMLKDIDRRWCVGWVEFLKAQNLGINTAATYNKVLRAMFNEAVREELLASSPLSKVDGISGEETMREYLTAEEVQTLVATPCEDNEVKRAFLFACLSGLRRCDITALKWADVKSTDNGTRLELRQRKTKGLAYIDLTPDAVSLLGERGKADESIFMLPTPTNTALRLGVWCARAGIDKHITFHSARHTFATLLLTRGADLYTVSKLLGHKSINTTQIYAKIVDEKRRAAVSLLDGLISQK